MTAILDVFTAEQLAARDAETRHEAYELAARVVCSLCAMGHRPRKESLGWTHPGVPGYTDPRGCDAAKIRDLS